MAPQARPAVPPEGPALIGPEEEARLLREFAVPHCLSILLGNLEVSARGAKSYVDDFLKEAGNPRDPVERSLVEQLACGHLELAALRARASRYTRSDQMKMVYDVVARLCDAMRRLALALRAYRAPNTAKPIAVFNQQNVLAAGEGKEVSPVVISSPEQKELEAGRRSHTVVNEDEPRRGGNHGRRLQESEPKEPSARRRRAGERPEAPPLGG